ncbi:MAG: CDP-alcohol phosphatidyltransferase family protein [Clostridia bacterium]|nr:CDP-alcohol phosphatidyltransferase family protein [Clostridia bacterium]
MKPGDILLTKRNLNLPNILSIIRILMVGVLIMFFRHNMRFAAFLTFVAASATDALDGYIARKYNLITPLGKLLDPLADKLMLTTVLACMYFVKILPLWIVLIIFIKEFVQILGGFLLFHRKDTVVQSNIFGKLTTVFFAVSVVLLFWHEYVVPFDEYALLFTVAFAVLSLVQYFVKYIKDIRTQEAMNALKNSVDEQADQK